MNSKHKPGGRARQLGLAVIIFSVPVLAWSAYVQEQKRRRAGIQRLRQQGGTFDPGPSAVQLLINMSAADPDLLDKITSDPELTRMWLDPEGLTRRRVTAPPPVQTKAFIAITPDHLLRQLTAWSVGLGLVLWGIGRRREWW